MSSKSLPRQGIEPGFSLQLLDAWCFYDEAAGLARFGLHQDQPCGRMRLWMHPTDALGLEADLAQRFEQSQRTVCRVHKTNASPSAAKSCGGADEHFDASEACADARRISRRAPFVWREVRRIADDQTTVMRRRGVLDVACHDLTGQLVVQEIARTSRGLFRIQLEKHAATGGPEREERDPEYAGTGTEITESVYWPPDVCEVDQMDRVGVEAIAVLGLEQRHRDARSGA